MTLRRKDGDRSYGSRSRLCITLTEHVCDVALSCE